MTSRQRLLDYLKAHPGATSGEMARAFRQTQANVRHHLAVLRRDQLITSTRRPATGRGRPPYAYTAGERERDTGLARLSGALLELHLAEQSGSEREIALRALSARLGAAPPDVRSAPLFRRFSELVEALSDLNYRPHWEARAAGPQIILGNCPFADIIAEHPELCEVDAYILEAGLGQPVKQLAKLEPSERGVRVCLFAVR